MPEAEKFSGEQIIRLSKADIGPWADYYSGRGNKLCDLNSKILEQIHDTIREKIGPEAANSFVAMIADMTKKGDVSASTFITSLDTLARNGWVFNQNSVQKHDIAQPVSDAISKGEDPMAAFMGVLAGAFSSGYEDPASSITGEFLRTHKFAAPERTAKLGTFAARYLAEPKGDISKA